MGRRDRRDEAFDGVRVTARPRRSVAPWLALLALALAAGAGWWVFGRASQTPSNHARGDGADAGAPSSSVALSEPPMSGASAARARASGARAEGEDPTPDLSDYVLPGEAPEMGQVIAALHARGIRSGLGAFQPPGTSPPIEGIEVPADFPLPEGYVRHHQATDDGQRIAPILMFGPDIDTIVVRGVRVPVPADRVVPPELVPDGMPVRRVRIPPPLDAGGRP